MTDIIPQTFLFNVNIVFINLSEKSIDISERRERRPTDSQSVRQTDRLVNVQRRRERERERVIIQNV